MSIPIFRRTTSNSIRLFDTVKRFTLFITSGDYVRVVTIARLVQSSRYRATATLRIINTTYSRPKTYNGDCWDCPVPLPCDYSISHLNLIVNTRLRRTTSKSQVPSLQLSLDVWCKYTLHVCGVAQLTQDCQLIQLFIVAWSCQVWQTKQCAKQFRDYGEIAFVNMDCQTVVRHSGCPFHLVYPIIPY